MTILFIDSCAAYSDSGAFADKWDYTSDPYWVGHGDSVDLRSGAYGIISDNTTYRALIYKNIIETYTLYVGFAYKKTSDIDTTPVQFNYDSDSQVKIIFLASGAIEISVGSTLLATSISGLVTAISGWKYIEVGATIHASSGSVDVKINGSSVVSASGVDTQAISGGINRVQFNGVGHFTDIYFDDASFHAPAGKGMRIDMLSPNAIGTYSQMTPSTGSTNFLCVDDGRTSDNTDTDYVTADAVDEIDTYNVESVDSIGTDIDAVAINIVARQDDVGTVTYKPMIRVNSSDYLGSDVTTTTSYLDEQYIWELNPDDSAAWEETDINNAEFGMKRTA